jgi:hypothetical protein
LQAPEQFGSCFQECGCGRMITSNPPFVSSTKGFIPYCFSNPLSPQEDATKMQFGRVSGMSSSLSLSKTSRYGAPRESKCFSLSPRTASITRIGWM